MSRKNTMKRMLSLALALALALGGVAAVATPVYAQAGEVTAAGNGIGSSTSVAASEGADGTGGGVGGAERASGENVMPTAPLALGTAPIDAPGGDGAVAPGEDAGGDGAVTPGEGDNEESTAPTAPLAPHAATADAPGGEMPPAPQAINVITAFAPLESAALEYAFAGAPQTQDALPLPAVLAATVEGQTESVHVAVAWTPNAPYAGGMGETIFTAVPGEGYALAESVAAPQIAVVVSRFGVGAPGARALSEYNPAHVAAINAMINNNGLWWYNVDEPDNWDFATWDASTPKNLTGLYVSEMGLAGTLSLAGIDTLATLECYGNSLTALDVSGCSALRYLDCYNNKLTALDVTACAALEALYCGLNELETLTLGTKEWLGWLYCGDNYLTELDLSGVDLLEDLRCFNNQIDSLNVTHNTYLSYLDCSTNLLTALDVSGMGYLTQIYCYTNTNFPAGPLETLNASGCSSLTLIDCVNNSISSLNVSGCTDLQELYCYWNELETLDAGGLGNLTTLDCVYNPFKSLTLPDGKTLTVNVSPYGAGEVTLTGTAYYGVLDGPGITLTADEKLDYTFDGWTGDKNGASDTLSFDFDGDITVTANFSGGTPIVSSDATLHKVAGQSLQNVGQQAGSSTAPITASVTVSSGTASISIGDLAYADFATVNLYSDATFSTEESVALNEGNGGGRQHHKALQNHGDTPSKQLHPRPCAGN